MMQYLLSVLAYYPWASTCFGGRTFIVDSYYIGVMYVILYISVSSRENAGYSLIWVESEFSSQGFKERKKIILEMKQHLCSFVMKYMR